MSVTAECDRAPALQMRDLRKSFGATPIVRGVSLDIGEGERHAIIGPNGAGKSTLFNLISGRFAPTSGTIRLHGEDIAGFAPYRINRRGLARSFQVTNIFPRLTVFENLRCSVLWSLGYRYNLWRRVDKLTDANEQAEAIGLIAQKIKFRLKSVITMPVEKKAQYVVSMPAVSEILAARLLVAYHLAHQRPMMGSFLDALGIAHEDGMIADEEMKPPSPDALKKAAATSSARRRIAITLAASYPADDVSLYLSTLRWQDPETWGALGELPKLVGG